MWFKIAYCDPCCSFLIYGYPIGQFSCVQSFASFLRDNNDINLVSDDSCMCANLATQGDWCKRRRTDSVLSQSAQIGNMDNPRMRIPAEERRQRGRRKGGRESGGGRDGEDGVKGQGCRKGRRKGERVKGGLIIKECRGEQGVEG